MVSRATCSLPRGSGRCRRSATSRAPRGRSAASRVAAGAPGPVRWPPSRSGGIQSPPASSGPGPASSGPGPAGLRSKPILPAVSVTAGWLRRGSSAAATPGGRARPGTSAAPGGDAAPGHRGWIGATIISRPAALPRHPARGLRDVVLLSAGLYCLSCCRASTSEAMASRTTLACTERPSTSAMAFSPLGQPRVQPQHHVCTRIAPGLFDIEISTSTARRSAAPRSVDRRACPPSRGSAPQRIICALPRHHRGNSRGAVRSARRAPATFTMWCSFARSSVRFAAPSLLVRAIRAPHAGIVSGAPGLRLVHDRRAVARAAPSSSPRRGRRSGP